MTPAACSFAALKADGRVVTWGVDSLGGAADILSVIPALPLLAHMRCWDARCVFEVV